MSGNRLSDSPLSLCRHHGLDTAETWVEFDRLAGAGVLRPQAGRAGPEAPPAGLPTALLSWKGRMKLSKTDHVFLGIASVSGALCLAMKGAAVTGLAMVDAAAILLEVLPQLAAGLLIGGLIHQLVSQKRVAALLGAESGLRGVLLATIAGAITPGGPFTSFPLVHALWISGADAGALISYLSAWALIGLNRVIVWELPFMGIEFTMMRVIACLPLPIIAGFTARWLVRSTPLRLERPPEA
jgi:uncharacterized membrane protein YraQ (UPF0718 family)